MRGRLMPDIEGLRDRIKNPDEDKEGIDAENYADDRENLLEASKIMGRHRTEKRGWGDSRHHSVLQRLIMLSWGGPSMITRRCTTPL